MAVIVKGREARLPFRDRSHLLRYEAAYRAGRWKTHQLVTPRDLEREQWLIANMPALRESAHLDIDAAEKIYLWKMATTVGEDCPVPPGIRQHSFLASCAAFVVARREDIVDVISSLMISGLRIIKVSAFLYWMRPLEFPVIDQRATGALDLTPAEDSNYSIPDYLDYAEACKELATAQSVSLRVLDRALFVYHALMMKGESIP